MDLRNSFLNNPSFSFERNIFYQKGMERQIRFEKDYIKLREKEGRLYSDEIVQNLPDIPKSVSLAKEWKVRKISMNKLISYLNQKKISGSILELGCGNGWLAHNLTISVNAEICALDVNETELVQGARLFMADKNLTFVYADIFKAEINKATFDTIILASSVHYFPDMNQLIYRLLELLKPAGEIHIIDTPFYSCKNESNRAKERSRSYFESQGMPAMANGYYHHTLLDLKNFNLKILFDPNRPASMFKRKILRIPQITFHWILITNEGFSSLPKKRFNKSRQAL